MIRLYMDVHVKRVIVEQLRLRGIDVLTAQEDGRTEADDAVLLERAGELGRLLFTQDQDFLRIAAQKQKDAKPFVSILYAPQLGISIGQCVEDLELIALAGAPEDFANQVKRLPL